MKTAADLSLHSSALSGKIKTAVTHYHTLFSSQDWSLITLKLDTGRTHQIRVHMAYIKHPLLGDAVYGPKNQPYHLQGQTLHAGVLGFIHPSTKEYVEFSSELPEYFQKLLKQLEL